MVSVVTKSLLEFDGRQVSKELVWHQTSDQVLLQLCPARDLLPWPELQPHELAIRADPTAPESLPVFLEDWRQQLTSKSFKKSTSDFSII